MVNYLILLTILFIFVTFTIYFSKSGFVDYVIVPAWRRRYGWRRRLWPYGPFGWHYRPFGWRYWREGFKGSDNLINDQSKQMNERDNNEDLDNISDTSKLYNLVPYHLLSDEYNSLSTPETISNLNSQGCYNTDFQRLIEKTGNYAQMTNNYKRQYPDSCSGTPHELVSSFYKVQPMIISKQ